MSTIRRTIGPVAIGAAGVTSAPFTVPDGLTDVWIKMSACADWATSSGQFAMGVESSVDGGATWQWVTEAGFIGTGFTIGTTFRGLLPAVAATVGNLVGASLRARAKTDGATIHPTFQIITEP